MDALGDILAPYNEFLGQVAGTITTLQFLSGIFFLNDIRKKGSSDAFPPEPFLGGLALSVLASKLALIMDNSAMIKTNVIGFGISIIFLAVFYYYASKEFRLQIWSKAAKFAIFTLVCMVYASYEDPAKIEFRLGLLLTAILVYLVGSPLLHLNEIIEKKSTEGMPFPIIFTGTLVAASWTLYGISIKNSVVIYQNLLLFVMSAIQLSLFVIYPSTPSVKTTPTTTMNAATKKNE